MAATASRTKISTSQSRHRRIAHANASGMKTSGTTDTVERSGEAKPEGSGQRRQQDEGREAHRDAERDPAGLFLGVGAPRMPRSLMSRTMTAAAYAAK